MRELARTLGYELRPGVAAQVELAFDAETATGHRRPSLVPRSTPVQSVPGQDELPQIFETSDDLVAREAWNFIVAIAVRPQQIRFGRPESRLRGSGLGICDGDRLLVVGLERLRHGQDAAADGGDRWICGPCSLSRRI